MARMGLLIGSTFAFWLLQVVSMQYLVVNKSRWSIVVALCMFLGGTLSLAREMHKELDETYNPDTALLWLPFALQIIRYSHALSVGGVKFAKTFGLTTFSRVAAFTLCVPTITFYDSNISGDKANSRSKGLWILARGMLFLAIFVAANTAVLELDKSGYLDSMPWWLERICVVALFAIATSLNDILFNGPTRLLIGSGVSVIDTNDNLILCQSPRDIWRRLTICAGHHLRKGYYDPLGGNGNIIAATVATFGVNTVIHIFWWGPVTKGKLDWEFVHVLFVLPIATIIIDEMVLGPRGWFGWSRQSLAYKTVGYIQLLIVVVVISPTLSRVMGLPTSLRLASMKNLGQSTEG